MERKQRNQQEASAVPILSYQVWVRMPSSNLSRGTVGLCSAPLMASPIGFSNTALAPSPADPPPPASPMMGQFCFR